MNLVTDAHVVDNSSMHEILSYYSSNKNPMEILNNHKNTMTKTTNVNMNNLIQRLMSTVHEPLDNAQQCKAVFSSSSMQTAFYQVLCEIKDKIGKIIILDLLIIVWSILTLTI